MIKTERLTLRPFREGDAADVFAYLSGPQPHCFECMKVRTMEEARAAVELRRSRSAISCWDIFYEDSLLPCIPF